MSHWGEWRETVDTYLTAAAARGFSPGTIRLRRWQLIWLADKVAPLGPWEVTTEDLERALAQQGWGRETRRSRHSAVKSFYRWAWRTGRTSSDLAALLPGVRVPVGKPRPCPEIVLADALADADLRTRRMLLLGAYCGLRAAEIARSHSRDLSADRLLRVVGKGDRPRDVPILHPELLDAFRAADGYLFPGRSPERPMTAGHVTKLVSRALPPGWTCHTLRHRFGTRALEATGDLAAVQELLGHTSPVTTRIYTLVSTDALLAAVAGAA